MLGHKIGSVKNEKWGHQLAITYILCERWSGYSRSWYILFGKQLTMDSNSLGCSSVAVEYIVADAYAAAAADLEIHIW